jgi:transcriptional regulator with XRE-family HTH domain
MENTSTVLAAVASEVARKIVQNQIARVKSRRKTGAGRKADKVSARGATEIDLAVGRVVRTRRIELGMSQTDLANACGITFQQIQKYENGANRISCSRLWQFAAVLGLPAASFFEGLGKANVDQKRARIARRAAHQIDDDTAKIARKIASIADPKLRQKLKTMLAALAGQ